MDETSIDETCPQCGAQVSDPSHDCAAATPERGETVGEETTRIEIPAAVWNTGLFKSLRRAAGPVISGSLLHRPEDLPSPVEPAGPAEPAEPTDAEPPEAPAEAPEAAGAGDVEAATSPVPTIDESFVVPAFLIAASEGRTHENAWNFEDSDFTPTLHADPTDTPPIPPVERVSAIQANDEAVAAGHQAHHDSAETPAPEPAPDTLSSDDTEAATAALLALLYPEPTAAPVASRRPLASYMQDDETEYAGATGDVAPYGAEDDEKPRRRGALIGIGGLVFVVAAASGGWFWWQHQQNAPVRDAFATSHGSFVAAVKDLEQASSLDDVAAAGTAFGEMTAEFEETTQATSGSNSTVAVAARRATLAEREVATAGAYLADLSNNNFSPWLEARSSLTAALKGLDSVRADVDTAGGNANDLPDDGLAAQVAGLIGAEASELAVEKTDQMFAALADAKRVADVRAIGTDAAGSADALRTAAAGVGSEDDAEALEQHTELHSQLGKLANLRPATLSRWAGIRDRLVTRVDFLPDSGAEARRAIDEADEMLGAAISTWQKWQRESTAAQEAKESDLAAITAVENTLERVGSDFVALESSLGALIERGATLESNGLEGDAYARLSGAADARDRLRNSIIGLDAPEPLEGELAAIASALQDSANSVRAAAGAASECAEDCVLTETDGWIGLVDARGAQRTRFDAAIDAWEPAAEKAREAIEARKPPRRPKI